MIALLGGDPARWRYGAGGRHRRDREGQPCIPSRCPIGGVEFAVALQIQITLPVACRKQESDLQSVSQDTRPESSQDWMCAEIIRDLLVSISDQTDKHLLRQKLRSTPIDVKIDTVLIIRILVLEIVGKASDGRKFVPGCRIEVGVTAAIDGPVADAEIGEAGGIVGADGRIRLSRKS